MTSAANKAAKTLKGSRRNRPSLSMSQASASVGESSGENLRESFTGGSTGGGGGGGPLFMDDLQSQYESLSEKLTKENNTIAASSQYSDLKSGTGSAGSKSRKVRWAETAAVASTLDAENAAAANDDDPDRYERSPMEIISDLFQRKYTLPIFLLSTLAIFLMVHLAGGGDEKYKRYDAASSKKVGLTGSRFQRYKNLEGGEGFGETTFSLSPTSSDMSSIGPTSEAIGHSTPKIPGSSSSAATANDGNAADWIIVPTQSGVFGTAGGNAANDGSPTTLKWNFAPGQPTPDPIHLKDDARLNDVGSPTTLSMSWNYPPGVPTPDPALLIEVAPDRGTPTTLKWSAENPLLHPDLGTPTTLKWSINNPSPAEATWDYPPGVPTPDPALLTYGGSDTLVWGYPPGEPTPDPIHLVHVPDDATLVWGYPPSYPTPDPVFLVNGGATEVLKWNYPEGEPTPDPAQLSQILMGPTDPPTIRNVEVGIAMSPPPTRRPTSKPTVKPVSQIDDGILLKMDNIEVPAPVTGSPVSGTPPITPKEEPAISSPPTSPGPTAKPTEKPSQPPTPNPSQAPVPVPVITEPDVLPLQDGEDPQVDPQTRAPQPPQVIYDAFGNIVEAAPPPRPPPRPQRPARPGRPPRPAVVVNEVDAWTYWDGPNGVSIDGRPGFIPGQPGQPEQPGVPGQIPGQVPLMGGVVNTQTCGGGCCGCCCGGAGASGGTTYNLVLPHGDSWKNLVALLTGGTGNTKSIALTDALPGFTMAPSLMKQPECPWSCVIDENVPTHGQSNQDDAIYEIFYSNPLNCCGTIVEVGAGNGVEGSGSYFFEYGMNWTSILTEADPKKYSKLVKNRNGSKARTLNGAFCKDGPYALYDEATSLFKSVGDDIISETVSMDVPDTAQNVPCIRLDRDVLAGVKHVNVMMVHVSGDPWPVLTTMDWSVSVDIWVLELDETGGMSHETLRAALKLHGYVQAKWDIKLWCDAPNSCMQNEVWLREGFNPISKQILQAGLRGSSATS